MKKVLFATAMLASTMSFSQSNTKGTIHLGLNGGFLIGGAKLKTTGPGLDGKSEKGAGIRAGYALKVGYGLADAFSLGLFVRSEGAAYATTTDNNSTSSSSTVIAAKGIGFGLEPKVYVLNKDKFNMYFALPIGFTTGKAYDTDAVDVYAKTSGLNYGLHWGFNWYWADFIGMSLDLGYAGISQSGKYVAPLEDYKLSYSGGGLLFGIGLVSRFGGK